MSKIKSEQSIALPSGSSPSHQNQQHPITTAVKTINLANISFKNNKKKGNKIKIFFYAIIKTLKSTKSSRCNQKLFWSLCPCNALKKILPCLT